MHVQGFVSYLLLVSLAFEVLSMPAPQVDNDAKSIMETDYCIIPRHFWEMTLVISLPRCKVENIEEVQSALDILDKYNIVIMPSENSDDVNLHKNDIRSNFLNLKKFDSKWVSRSSPPYNEENERRWAYFPYLFGNPFIEVLDRRYS